MSAANTIVFLCTLFLLLADALTGTARSINRNRPLLGKPNSFMGEFFDSNKITDTPACGCYCMPGTEGSVGRGIIHNVSCKHDCIPVHTVLAIGRCLDRNCSFHQPQPPSPVGLPQEKSPDAVPDARPHAAVIPTSTAFQPVLCAAPFGFQGGR